MTDSSRIDVQQEFSQRLTVHKTLDQEVVVTTVDKLRLCLIHNQDCLAAKREWVLPLSLFVTLGATLLASDFNDFVLKAAVWEAIFILGAIGCAIWLLRAGTIAWKNRAAGGIDSIVAELKVRDGITASETPDTTSPAA